MTLPEFSEVFALLAVQLRATDVDEATIRGYYEALNDLELEMVQMSARTMAVSCAWFPKTSEWRDAAGKVERDRLIAQRALLRKLPTPLCRACQDTSWEHAGDGVKPCSCRHLRRMEVLGRLPWPSLPEAPAVDETLRPVPELVRALVASKEMP